MPHTKIESSFISGCVSDIRRIQSFEMTESSSHQLRKRRHYGAVLNFDCKSFTKNGPENDAKIDNTEINERLSCGELLCIVKECYTQAVGIEAHLERFLYIDNSCCNAFCKEMLADFAKARCLRARHSSW